MESRSVQRVMLVDDTAKEVGLLREALRAAGFEVVCADGSALELPRRVAQANPDIIIVDTESPTRDVLEQVCVVSQNAPRPIVMFTADGDNASIQAALRAGVAAYVVDGFSPERLASILEVANARFEVMQDLRGQLAEAQGKLSERKLIERAKGLVMKRRGVSEEEAYRLLRKMAMDRGAKLVDLARQLVEMADLLG
jgi:response regulator NasT